MRLPVLPLPHPANLASFSPMRFHRLMISPTSCGYQMTWRISLLVARGTADENPGSLALRAVETLGYAGEFRILVVSVDSASGFRMFAVSLGCALVFHVFVEYVEYVVSLYHHYDGVSRGAISVDHARHHVSIRQLIVSFSRQPTLSTGQ